MTVAELRERMPAAEFVFWKMYYARIAQRAEVSGG